MLAPAGNKEDLNRLEYMEAESMSKVLDDLKNRFASRFIFSFTMAWLIYNWQITVALFWYDKTQFQAEGCKSIFEFISDQLKNNTNSIKAFWTALIYTLGLPISKSLINIWDEVILDLRNWTKTKLIRNQDAKIIKNLNSKLKRVSDNSLINGVWMYNQNIHENENPQQVFFKNGDWYFIKNDKESYFKVDKKCQPQCSRKGLTRIIMPNGYIRNTTTKTTMMIAT